jgi:hypothetical protein
VKMLFERRFLLASAASLCQNTAAYVDEASLTKLERNSWREARGGTKAGVTRYVIPLILPLFTT